ncbi:MAG: HypC/HybG/HupF family hydrogenase formation chaperone [Candidatus Portnoybacteria bacterium]|nr:HypC/HybG/HupF family hydrogenase formation chaperone [Candidatus Portnoybacteria bacterium]
MCLSLPAKILKIKNEKAIVDFSGQKAEVSMILIKNAKPGHYAIINNGFIIKTMPPKEAEKTIKEIKEVTK